MSKLKKINISEIEGSDYSVFPWGTIWVDLQNRLRISDGVTEGGQPLVSGASGDPAVVYPTAGSSTAGIIFPSNPGGGSGDIASIKYYATSGEQMRLHIDIQNDIDDHILMTASGPITIQPNEHAFVFGTDGALTLPSGGDIKDSTGNSVIGGAANLGRLKIQNDILGTVDNPDTGGWGGWNLNIDPGGESSAGISIPSVANQQGGGQLQIFNTDSSGGKININTHGGLTIGSVRGTLGLGLDLETPGLPDHFHIAFETSNTYIPTKDLFFGDDYNYVQLINSAQGIFIGTNDRTGGSQHKWRFNTNGKFILTNSATIENTVDNGNVPGGIVLSVNSNETKFDTSGRTHFPNDLVINYGGITFADASSQTTAWNGGRVRPAPATSIGSSGDLQGDIAFDSNYFYYCTANYGGTQYVIGSITSSVIARSYLIMYDSNSGWTSNDLTGFTVSGSGGYSGTVTGPSQDQGGGQWYIPVSPDVTQSMNPYTFSSGSDVWKRVAYSGSTW